MAASVEADLDHDALIRAVPMFAEVSDDEAEELWRSAERVKAARGEVIITDGAPGDRLYIVLSGALERLRGAQKLPVRMRPPSSHSSGSGQRQEGGR